MAAALAIFAAAVVFVAWWAGVWGRSVAWAVIGSVLLSPAIWALVLLILGRHPDKPRR